MNIDSELEQVLESIKEKGYAFTSRSFLNAEKTYDARASVSRVTGQRITNYSLQNAMESYRARKIERVDKLFHDLALQYHPPGDCHYLDAACADGLRTSRNIEFLSEHFTIQEAIGIDISPGMIRFAEKHLGKGNAQVLDLNEIVFLERFSLITLLFQSMGLIQPERIANVLARIHDSLKPGGLFFLDVLSFQRDILDSQGFTDEDYRENRFYRTYYFQVGDQKHLSSVRMFREEEIQCLLIEAGFDILDFRIVSDPQDQPQVGIPDLSIMTRKKP